MGNEAGDPFAKHEVRELIGHKRKVVTLGWNSNGKRLATGAEDGAIKIWRLDPRHGKPERAESELLGHSDVVVYLKWDPTTADRLASTANDKTVRIWDARSSRCLGTVKAAAALLYITWKGDGTQLGYVDRSDTIGIVDVKSAKLIKSHRLSDRQVQVNGMLWSPDGKLCFVALGNGAIDVLEYPSFQKLRSFVGHASAVYHLCFDPTGRYLASAGNDASVCLWDASDMVCIKTFTGMDNEISTLSWSHNSKYLAYIDYRLGICIVDVDTGRMVHTVPLQGHMPDSLDWNPRHMVLAWPSAFTSDYRDSSRDSGPVAILAPT